jgi:hypothetical protein
MVVSSKRNRTSSTLLEPVAWSCFRSLGAPKMRRKCRMAPHSVILSGVGGREASDNAVEGSLCTLALTMARQGVLPSSWEQWWKRLSKFVALQAGMRSFDCAAASRSRSSRCAQDDSRVE